MLCGLSTLVPLFACISITYMLGYVFKLEHLGPTSTAVTPLCWWCQPDQRAEACWGHPHPKRVDPLGPPQGITSGPDSSGTWGDRTQETHKPINSSYPSKPTGGNTHQCQGSFLTKPLTGDYVLSREITIIIFFITPVCMKMGKIGL